MDRQVKNEAIKTTLKQTRDRRKSQVPVCVELKIKTQKLSKSDYDKLQLTFTECKWLYNYLLSLEKEELMSFDTRTRDIFSLDKDGNKVERNLGLPAKFIQSVYRNLIYSMKGLKEAQAKGRKAGKLKFKSEYNSIELNQYGNTHEVKDNRKGLIRVSGFKKPFKVFGIEQINPSWEMANARLIHRPSGYYILLTCYKMKESTGHNNDRTPVGLDFGIKTSITDSDGNTYDIRVRESERLKGLQRKLSRQARRSNGWYRTVWKIRREHERLDARRKDKAVKVIHEIKKNHDIFVIQDENIRGWHKGLFGRQVQHSALGTIKHRLVRNENTIIVDRFFPSTKLCPECGNIHDSITLSDRTFICPDCGYTEGRDIKAAKTILLAGLGKITSAPAEHRSTKVERMSDFSAFNNAESSSQRSLEAGTL